MRPLGWRVRKLLYSDDRWLRYAGRVADRRLRREATTRKRWHAAIDKAYGRVVSDAQATAPRESGRSARARARDRLSPGRTTTIAKFWVEDAKPAWRVGDEPSPGWVRMRHPAIGGTQYAEVTIQAWNEVWRQKGWEVVQWNHKDMEEAQ